MGGVRAKNCSSSCRSIGGDRQFGVLPGLGRCCQHNRIYCGQWQWSIGQCLVQTRSARTASSDVQCNVFSINKINKFLSPIFLLCSISCQVWILVSQMVTSKFRRLKVSKKHHCCQHAFKWGEPIHFLCICLRFATELGSQHLVKVDCSSWCTLGATMVSSVLNQSTKVDSPWQQQKRIRVHDAGTRWDSETNKSMLHAQIYGPALLSTVLGSV